MSEAQPLTLSEPDTLPAGGRKKFDQYFTPEALAKTAVGWLVRDGYLWPNSALLEPSAGRGAWVEALRPLDPQVIVAVDIDPERVTDLLARFPSPMDFHVSPELGDFQTREFRAIDRYDGVIGNPPFNAAEEHVRAALRLRKRFGVVAFLLRLAFLESKDRIPFWKENPASKIYVLSERPSFSGLGGSTDNAAYGVFVWATWHKGPTEIEVCSWKTVPAANIPPATSAL